MKHDTSFIDACLKGQAALSELDEYIDYWHTNDTGKTLQEFLGITDYEYEQWGKSSDSIFEDILSCRQNNMTYEEYEAMLDDRADEEL